MGIELWERKHALSWSVETDNFCAATASDGRKPAPADTGPIPATLNKIAARRFAYRLRTDGILLTGGKWKVK
ncbi:hypothetical protein [Mesorhizobium retamae]|uniref:Uncharacterized protein n=1 Tax=Mesorhizobium retamae TaxID=2912854 RepID=A0ABS9QC95_9HYPH|nr:hypothetical protein [Mesorhizobium sp. IRAMC:0171]MCG7505036.1 hypothetical protein [Mesorhizobium sp. IRAMC:0171]